MAKFYTPQVRFANSGSALTLKSVQTVEPIQQLPSDRASTPDGFSGVIRYRRDFRRFLAPGGGEPIVDGRVWFQLGDLAGNVVGPGAGFGSVSGSGGGLFFSLPPGSVPFTMLVLGSVFGGGGSGSLGGIYSPGGGALGTVI